MKKPKLYERPKWRFALIIIALIVVVASISYTNTVVYQLKLDEQKNVELWFEAQKKMLEATPEEAEVFDFDLNFKIIEANSDIPIILTDEHYRIIDAMNYGDKDIKEDTAFFNSEVRYLSTHKTPVVLGDATYKNYLFYRQSTLITSLEWFPYFQFAILGVLLMLSYFTFSFNRQAEQERVWVGMAKETAHQLGTPITSLMGWIENIKMMYAEDENLLMIADEMNTDVELLKLVADRFSKIGAVPDLEPINIYNNLNKHLQYVQQRASRKITFDFPIQDEIPPLMVNINPLLFDWVIENLLKNALDAMEGKGQISAHVSDNEQFVYIDISDSGKGIPKKNFKSVFQPGYSTKKRGWGLGLSLCKRIVEKYHNGKIFVLQSTEGEGTTFRIQLPQIKQ
ncbi:sensor histidine kinase [Aureispira anguillae]|uniref:histidine kinase n=1 Tax=Aureispira anguillae TaxID=2864201 RepID=A0A916DUD6_9BACT|nr:HAMP domain-containing sensor histidine kinase [Aureispira anguillae]BDS12597.1 HAMP domain-containing histidine kinase [Aureispira anguillae]